MRFKLLIILNLLGFSIFAQQVGTEQVVTKSIYKGDFKVEGDKDIYYLVVFKFGNQNVINRLKIYRSFSEPGPVELHATHKRGLLLEIAAHPETYHSILADAMHSMHNYGFIVWLRGGGFLYHYESENLPNLQVACRSSEIIFDHTNPAYVVNGWELQKEGGRRIVF